MARAVRVSCLYRVSTKKQVYEDEIPMQKNACREFISTMPGWVLTKEYAEKGVSGYHKSAEQRDVLRQVRKDAENGLFDVLLVFMFDRLGRREDETPFIVEWFVANGIEVWSVKEGQQKFDNRADKLMNYIRFWQSGGESEKTSIRVREKHKQMVEEGKFRGGGAPYGYTLIKSGVRNNKGYELKKLALDENESKVVRTIFNLVTEYGYGGYKTAAYLNERKIPTKRGNAWTANSVMCLLKNPVYKGYYVSGKRRSERGLRKRTEPEAWIYSEEVQKELAIVDEAIWNKAEDIRNSRKEKTGSYPVQTKGPLLFVSHTKCGYCGMPMTSRYALKKWTRKSDGKEIRYMQPKYICLKRSSKTVCKGPSTYSQRKIDPIILEEVYSYLGMLKKTDLSAKIEGMQANALQTKKNELSGINMRIEKTEKEIEVLCIEIARCLTGESDFTSEQLSKIIELKEIQLEQLQRGKKKISTELDSKPSDIATSSDARKMTPNWKYEFEDAPQEVKKMLLAKLVGSVYIYADKIDVRFKSDLFNLR